MNRGVPRKSEFTPKYDKNLVGVRVTEYNAQEPGGEEHIFPAGPPLRPAQTMLDELLKNPNAGICKMAGMDGTSMYRGVRERLLEKGLAPTNCCELEASEFNKVSLWCVLSQLLDSKDFDINAPFETKVKDVDGLSDNRYYATCS